MRPAGPGNCLKSARRVEGRVRLAIAAALALAALAGCAQPAHPPAPAADGSPTAAQAWALDVRQAGCEAITWSVPVTAASLKPYLPDGFEPSPPEGQQGLDAAAALGFRTVECARGLGQGVDFRSVQSGQVFTRVVPPAELRDDRFGARYAYGWDVLAAPDAWRASAAGWGLPVHDGGSLVGPGAQGWTGALAMDKVGSFTINGRTVTSGAASAGDESRLITAGAQGFALWDTETANVTTLTGAGAWEVSPESWVAKVLGSTQGVALFEHATFDVPSGVVHWPGQVLSPVDGQGQAVQLPGLPERPPVATS
jgi:hypothetical protein